WWRWASTGSRVPGSAPPTTRRPRWNCADASRERAVHPLYNGPMTVSQGEWPRMLADAELDELDRFFRARADDDSLLLDGVHGLLTALAIGPIPVTPDQWLPQVLSGPFDDSAEGKRVLALLSQLN